MLVRFDENVREDFGTSLGAGQVTGISMSSSKSGLWKAIVRMIHGPSSGEISVKWFGLF